MYIFKDVNYNTYIKVCESCKTIYYLDNSKFWVIDGYYREIPEYESDDPFEIGIFYIYILEEDKKIKIKQQLTLNTLKNEDIYSINIVQNIDILRKE